MRDLRRHFALWSDRQLARFQRFGGKVEFAARHPRRSLLAILGAEHILLHEFLRSEACAQAWPAFQRGLGEITPADDPRKVLEWAYLEAQRQGCPLSGWKLRFVLYYLLGKQLGEWD